MKANVGSIVHFTQPGETGGTQCHAALVTASFSAGTGEQNDNVVDLIVFGNSDSIYQKSGVSHTVTPNVGYRHWPGRCTNT